MVQRSEPQQPAPAAPEAGAALASSRRRRFIQAGVVPVSLTLASRPVMAWHCNSTSAWGSAVLRNGVASVVARAENKRIYGNECWTIQNWTRNTVRGKVSSKTPWAVVGETYFRPACSAQYAKDNLTVSALYSSLVGANSTDKVFTLISTAPNSFVAYMLMARLNAMLTKGIYPVADCMLSNGKDMMPVMAAKGPGAFKPTDSTGAPWTEADIKNYLYKNYLVRPDET